MNPPAVQKEAAEDHGATLWLLVLAAATVVFHLVIGNRYGFHRDELATLEDARHLAWGYVAYPPLTPFFARLSLIFFGDSLTGFRFFASLASAASMVMTGMMARELGGSRAAQLIAAGCVAPFCLAAGALMQYVAFDYLLWTTVTYLIIRLVRSGDTRWWVAVGAAIGVGMMNKYTMGVWALAVAGGAVLTGLRAHLRSKWLWIGLGLSLLIFLPNAIWQWQHQFISLDFLRHIHARDVRIGRTKDFFPDQVKFAMLAFPIAVVGLIACFRAFDRRFRVLGWMFVIALVVLAAAKGRGYYLCGAYPPLFAAGTVRLTQAKIWRYAAFRTLTYAALLVDVVIVVALVLPLAPIGSGLFKKAIAVNGDLVEEIGWPNLTATVAGIRDSLPENEKSGLAILAGNYGEAGALTLFGAEYNLPPVISGINSFGLRGYGDPPPQRVIVLGIDRDFLDEHFSACRVVGHTPNPYDIENEETRDHPDIYLCGPPKRGWAEFWESEFPWFG